MNLISVPAGFEAKEAAEQAVRRLFLGY